MGSLSLALACPCPVSRCCYGGGVSSGGFGAEVGLPLDHDKRAHIDARAVRGRSSRRWRRSPGSVARRRVLAELRRQGVQLPRWEDSFDRVPHGHVGTRRVATSIWFCVDGQWWLGLCRMGRKKLLPMRKGSSTVRQLWSWDLCRGSRRNATANNAAKGNAWTLDYRCPGWRERARHPDFWFCAYPRVGCW